MASQKRIIKNSIMEATRKIALGKFNDVETRAEVLDYLQEKFPDIPVICNETNNSPEIIDRNEIVIDALIEEIWCKMILGPKASGVSL